MKYTGPKTRLARRVGEVLRAKDAKYMVKRGYPPGMHGQSRRRTSEFGIHHWAKQKAKWIYNVTEKQFRKYVEAAMGKRGMTGNVLLESLELRLDNVVFRLGFAISRAQSRQLVNHGFFLVNRKKVNIPSYAVKVGDQISVNDSKKSATYIQQITPLLKEFKTQEWVTLDAKNFSGKVLSKPTPQITGSTIEMDLIVEHYNR